MRCCLRRMSGLLGRNNKVNQLAFSSQCWGAKTAEVHGDGVKTSFPTPSVPGITMSNSFKLDKPASFSITEQEKDNHVYTRWSNPTVRNLETKLAFLESGEDCIAYASGMAATAGLLLSRLSNGDHLIMSDINYAGTAELVRHTLPRFGIDVSLCDTSNLNEVKDCITPRTKLIWIETPCNPTLRLTDISAISEICKDNGCELAVDSTFATPVAQKPINFGADFVVHSLTKYIGGHGDSVGGAIVGRSAEAIQQIKSDSLVHQGGILSPFNAFLISRGAITLSLRMAQHEKNAKKVAQFLESHPLVTRVNYPGLQSHEQHELAKRQMNNFGGMLSFTTVKGTTARLSEKMMKELSLIHYAVSLGHSKSLLFMIETDAILNSTFGPGMSVKQIQDFKQFAGEEGIFRMSVGLEEADDIIRDLDQVLKN